jgi:hypothetical protein
MKKNKTLAAQLKAWGAEPGDDFYFTEKKEGLPCYGRFLTSGGAWRKLDELGDITITCVINHKTGKPRPEPVEPEPRRWTVAEIREQLEQLGENLTYKYLATVEASCYPEVIARAYWARVVNTLWRLEEKDGEQELVKVDIDELMGE